MVHAVEEVEEFVAISGSLVVNIGTLDAPWVNAMRLASAKAHAMEKPWVFDPVGVGATQYRTDVSALLLQNRPSVIRGNASEILALAGQAGHRKALIPPRPPAMPLTPRSVWRGQSALWSWSAARRM